ncbi:unnamed protein product [Amaranthus hypochondriacus]
MLQRAASNAYSWWYASHVRTKQSKWLEQSLQDMGDKVEAMLKLIQEDGDSFAKRAEMYYKRRPELINFVEESYRAYRSLAERYDHISKELQNANTTLASAFPDQYQFPIDDDDDYNSPRKPKKFKDRSPFNSNSTSNSHIPQAPPKFPSKNIKAIIALTSKFSKAPPSKNGPKSGGHANRIPKSGLTIDEAVNEIDKLQKQILTLQTEKEFAKSSYESGYAKYWDIDEQINGTQDKISRLQDEFGVSQVIEDDEARTLMAEAAIKSCNDTLAELQEKQDRTAAEAKAEYQRIKEARSKLNSLKGELLGNQTDASQSGDPLKAEEPAIIDDEAGGGLKESKDLEILRDKIKEHFDVGETASLGVLEMAEKIDELVNKVISLESLMSSQTALTHTLRLETDELQSQIKGLEDDKANLIAGKTTLSDKLGEMEDKLRGLEIEELHAQIKNLEDDKANLIAGKTSLSDKLGEMEDKLRGCEIEELQARIKNLEDDKTDLIDGKTTLSDKLGEIENKFRGVEIDELQSHIKSLEHDNISLIALKTTLSDKLGEMENKIRRLEELLKSQESKGFSGNMVVEKEVMEGRMVCSNIGQDGKESLGETALESKDESGMRSRTYSFQLQESQPSTIDSDQPQGKSNNNKVEAVATQLRDHLSNPQDEPNAPLSLQPSAQKRKEDDEPDWHQLFTSGLEGKEKILLEEYTATLRNYKETKKRLCEVETKNQESFSEIEKQLNELKNSLDMKNEEIHSLRKRMIIMQKRLDEYKNAQENDMESRAKNEEFDGEDDIRLMFPVEGKEISPVEQKLRADIDQILEENLDFWMRFSATFSQVQKFQNVVQDLQGELAKVEKNQNNTEGSNHGDTHTNSSLKSNVTPIYKHLRETQTELTVWLEKSEKLKEELQKRFTQLCHIQDEIKHALSTGAEDDDMKFTSFQAAKFQGEVANMQQENHKVADELQAGMDYITSLQLEVERTLTRLNDELEFSSSQNQNEAEGPGSQARVPLRSFIFGVKPPKKKQSIFSCMHPGMMHRRYHHLKADKSP